MSLYTFLFGDGREKVKPQSKSPWGDEVDARLQAQKLKLEAMQLKSKAEIERLTIRPKLKNPMAYDQTQNAIWQSITQGASGISGTAGLNGITLGVYSGTTSSGTWTIPTPGSASVPFDYIPYEVLKVSVVLALVDIENTVNTGQTIANLYFTIKENQFYRVETNYAAQPGARTTTKDEPPYLIKAVIINPDGTIEDKIIVKPFEQTLNDKEQELFEAFDSVLQPDIKKIKHKPILEQVKDYIDKHQDFGIPNPSSAV